MVKGFAAATREKARVVIVKLPEGPRPLAATAASGGRGGGKRQGGNGKGDDHGKQRRAEQKPFWDT